MIAIGIQGDEILDARMEAGNHRGRDKQEENKKI